MRGEVPDLRRASAEQDARRAFARNMGRMGRAQEEGERMKALTLTQPWATLVAVGSKRIETRSWAPPKSILGERIAIHAAKGFPKECQRLVYEEPFTDALIYAGLNRVADLPRGVVVATAVLRNFWSTNETRCLENLCEMYDCEFKLESEFGDYSKHRFAWVLTDVEQFTTSIAAKGMLGLWEWTP
jgi:hypothetical protein